MNAKFTIHAKQKKVANGMVKIKEDNHTILFKRYTGLHTM